MFDELNKSALLLMNKYFKYNCFHLDLKAKSEYRIGGNIIADAGITDHKFDGSVEGTYYITDGNSFVVGDCDGSVWRVIGFVRMVN